MGQFAQHWRAGECEEEAPVAALLHRMNLVNMLDAPLPESGVFEEPETSVFYLPAPFSALQRDLSEALVGLFQQPLLREIAQRRRRTSITSLLADEDAAEAAGLFYLELKAVLMHPALVVDHFIPKKLLLLELKGRLCAIAGKTELFERILNALCDAALRKEIGNYTVLVVCQDVKELEWIEGLVIGMPCEYEKVSASKLYEEGTDSESEREEEPESRRRRWAARHAKRSAGAGLAVHLVTLRQLYLFSLLATYLLIFSFDADLDVASPAVELVRSALLLLMRKTPVFVPVVAFSVEHIARVIGEPAFDGAEALAAWRREVVGCFVVNRTRITDFVAATYGQHMEAVHGWLGGGAMPLLEPFSEQLTRLWSAETLQALLEPAAGFGSSHTLLGYALLKEALAQALHARRAQLQQQTVECLARVPRWREAETARQLQIDAAEEAIGHQYQRLQRLNEAAAASDRRLQGADAEHARVEGVDRELRDMLGHLAAVQNFDTAEQQRLMALLGEERARLQREIGGVDERSEALRAAYQQHSRAAVEASLRLADLQDTLARLQGRLGGAGLRALPAQAREAECEAHRQRRRRLEGENDFLRNFFKQRLDKMVRERNAVLETHGRPSTRVSRAATPY